MTGRDWIALIQRIAESCNDGKMGGLFWQIVDSPRNDDKIGLDWIALIQRIAESKQ